MPKQILDHNGRPVQPVLAEIVTPTKRNPYASYLGNLKENPDRILKNKAGSAGVAFYEDMLETDTKLFSLIQTRINGLLACPREILAASDDPQDDEIKDFIETNFDDLANFDEDLRELCDAIAKGFAVSEIMWTQDGSEVRVESIRSRDQKLFAFAVDTNELLLRKNAWLGGGDPVPARKFLVHSFGKKHENPYGSAVLRYCYWAYFFKKHSVKWWSIFNEKFGSPTAIGKYPRGLSSTDQDAIQEIIESIKTETGITLPDDITIDLLEAKISGNVQTHRDFIDLMDRWHSMAVLGGTLTSDAGKLGTQALGTVHDAVRSEYISADAQSLMAVVNHQLIPWMVDWNFANVESYPRLRIDTDPPKDLQATANTYKVLSKDMGLPIALRDIYETFGIRQPDPDDELLETPKPPPSPFGMIPGQQPPPDAQPPDGKPQPPPNPQNRKSPIANRKSDQDSTEDFQYRSFAEVASDLSPTQRRRARRAVVHPEEILAMARPLAGQIFQGWIEDLKTKLTKGLQPDQKLDRSFQDRADALDVDDKPLADLLDATLTLAHIRAQSDILTDAKLIPEEESFAEWPPAFEEAIRFLLKKEPKARTEFDKLTMRGKAKAFTAKLPYESRRAKRDLVREVQNLTVSAIRDGMTVDTFKEFIDEKMDAAGFTRLNDWHVETIFRTNIQDAYNAGRWTALHDPDIDEIVVAYTYVALEDDRTRPDHAAMNGKTFSKNDPIWAEWWPPNGFNCRCSVIPVFSGEEWSASEKLESIAPDEGFERNSAALQEEAA